MQDINDDVRGGIVNTNHDNDKLTRSITDKDNSKSNVARIMASKHGEQESKVSAINVHPNSKNKASKHVTYQDEAQEIYQNDEAIRNAINEFNNGQPSPTIHDLSTKYKIPLSVLQLYVTEDKSKTPCFKESVGNKRKNETELAQEAIKYEGLVSTDEKTKIEQRRERDAKQKRWRRRQMHLEKQINENLNEGNKKVKVWSGSIETGKWRTATKHSTFFDVMKMGKGSPKKEQVPNSAIMTFDGENDLTIVQERFCRKEQHCQAAQGNHPGAEYFSAMRLMTIQDMVCIKWPDRKKEEWLPKGQVKEPLGYSRSGNNEKDTFELTKIYETMRKSDVVRSNMMQTNLPFSNFGGFISFVESHLKTTFRGDYSKMVEESNEKEAKKAKRKEVKCKDCNKNEARRKGQLCNKCYNLKVKSM